MAEALMTLPTLVAAGDPDASRTGAPKPMDEARFEMFYRRNAGGLWSYLYRLTGDVAASDDLLQKAFFRFLRANPVLTSEEHQRRWLFRTATNLAFDHFRETKRDRAHAEPAPRADASTESRELLRHDMMKTFAELKPRERALLWLAHVEEADHETISEALGVKAKSVKVLLFRARKRLGDLLTRKGLGPEKTR
ncbi:MAG: sigma-70 family RNA polymerase sigma factor [Acidobacteria bacterium]|nr:sigma-70 family RNA polymerase sigma factor [Acidobacteriota bacterium]MBV9475254.1 sigma-70 family RNA polymerase sigma factor [Acidobacteriota bacterium]